MSDKTATERLRELLDERGEPYTKRDGMRATSITHITHWYASGVDAEFTEQVGGGTRLTATGLTPEQAIAATLGSGTCDAEIETALTLACKHIARQTGTCPYDMHNLDCADWEERCERECKPSIDQSKCWRRYFEQKAVSA